MRKLLLAIVFGALFVLSLAATALAEGRREIHVSVRPQGMSERIVQWAYYPGTGLTVLGDAKDFEKATNNLIVFVFDEEANSENTRNNCTLKQILEARGEQVRPDPHQPEGGLARCGGSRQGSKKEKGWDSTTAEAIARMGAGASLSSPAGEAGGSSRGVAGGMNPNADPPAGVQAAVAAVQIALSVVEIKQIVRNVTRFIAARATTTAEVTAIEKAAEEAIAQLRREGKAVSREAVEKAAREGAEEAERALRAGGQAVKAPGSAPTVVHVPGPRKPPAIGQSGTPLRSGATKVEGSVARTGTYGELKAAGSADAHHVIQDAAVRDLPGYSRSAAPAVELPGPSTRVGSPHYEATQVQRQPAGGNYAAERRVGYKALRKGGVPPAEARENIEKADAYFKSIGVSPSTPTRTPGNR